MSRQETIREPWRRIWCLHENRGPDEKVVRWGIVARISGIAEELKLKWRGPFTLESKKDSDRPTNSRSH